jgi:hypothetical protein
MPRSPLLVRSADTEGENRSADTEGENRSADTAGETARETKRQTAEDRIGPR